MCVCAGTDISASAYSFIHSTVLYILIASALVDEVVINLIALTLSLPIRDTHLMESGNVPCLSPPSCAWLLFH